MATVFFAGALAGAFFAGALVATFLAGKEVLAALVAEAGVLAVFSAGFAAALTAALTAVLAATFFAVAVLLAGFNAVFFTLAMPRFSFLFESKRRIKQNHAAHSVQMQRRILP